jgi:hypothetical protein
MNRERAEALARAVLYEGYMLYPYRHSSLKNQRRWMFGTLYPHDCEDVVCGTERHRMHIECLLDRVAPVRGQVRFLQPTETSGDCIERSFDFEAKDTDDRQHWSFSFPAANEAPTGALLGSVSWTREKLDSRVSKLFIDVSNETPFTVDQRDLALMRSMRSCHVMLSTEGPSFISLFDPPPDLREIASVCRNDGCFPVLLGSPGDRDQLLCSPIILYDYPQIAPESAGDFFDSTEMDEMLTLRVLTLSEEEKREMNVAGERVHELLDRTHATAREQLIKTHGVVRSMRRQDDR